MSFECTGPHRRVKITLSSARCIPKVPPRRGARDSHGAGAQFFDLGLGHCSLFLRFRQLRALLSKLVRFDVASTSTSTRSAASLRQLRHALREAKARQTATSRASTRRFDTSTRLRLSVSPTSTAPPLLLESGGVGGLIFTAKRIFRCSQQDRHQPMGRDLPTSPWRRERGEDARRLCIANQPV